LQPQEIVLKSLQRIALLIEVVPQVVVLFENTLAVVDHTFAGKGRHYESSRFDALSGSRHGHLSIFLRHFVWAVDTVLDTFVCLSMICVSQATVRNIRQNLFFAFGYNALGIPIAAGCSTR